MIAASRVVLPQVFRINLFLVINMLLSLQATRKQYVIIMPVNLTGSVI